MATTKLNESSKKKEDRIAHSNSIYVKKNYTNVIEDTDEHNPNRGNRNNKSKEQTKAKQLLDPQMVKYEAMKRIEREKRATHKKLMNEEYNRHRHSMLHKKTSKTNWTKHYENGTIDEELEGF